MSANKGCFTSAAAVKKHLLSFLAELAKTVVQSWTEVVRVTPFSWSLSQGEIVQSFTIKCKVSCRMFYQFKKFSSIPSFLRTFIRNRCSIFFKWFFYIYREDYIFIFCSFLAWWITWIDLQTYIQACIPRMNASLLWCIIFLIYCWIWFTKISFYLFHTCSWGIMVFSYLFL